MINSISANRSLIIQFSLILFIIHSLVLITSCGDTTSRSSSENLNESYSGNLIQNEGFEVWNQDNHNEPDKWMLGTDGLGIIDKEAAIVHEGHSSVKITHVDGLFTVLYQDIQDVHADEQPEFIFSAYIYSSKPDSVYLRLDTGTQEFYSSANTSEGEWEYLSMKGIFPADSSNPRVHLFVMDNAVAYFDKIEFVAGSHNDLLNSSESKIEKFNWTNYDSRLVYRSRYNNIAITFGTSSFIDGYFYENFYVFDVDTLYDYFCIPDDFILAYNENSSFRVKALALNWEVAHGVKHNGEAVFLEHAYEPYYGFNPHAVLGDDEHGSPSKSNWSLPPLKINVRHEMHYDEKYIPMKITVENVHDEPLRVLYVFQDGAWMTSADNKNQEGVYQYWPDGEYDYTRLWIISQDNRESKSNWVGMYNDSNGGMFAATYAPPESKGIRFHATWDDQTYIGSSSDVNCIDNILTGIDTPSESNRYDSTNKVHGTLIDFGVLQPGEKRTQLIVKIMFTGYRNRSDMLHTLLEIIDRIPPYDIPAYDLETYNEF